MHPQPQQPFVGQPNQSIQSHHLAFPALHLHPVNDTFNPKQIILNPNGAKIKIGRQTNQKTVPNPTNGFFDSKVLSRMHAEVWTENGKVLIKDVKSSNGTFINGERLSPEGVESEAFELHTEDLVEFGIDIIADDNKSIVHHKVATKVFLVLNAEDANAAACFYRANGPELSLNRRASRPGSVFGGGGFDHVLSRLQSELEKSRVTGQELSTLNSTINEIHDTLGGGTGPPPPLPPPYGGRIPPIVHQQPQQRQQQSLLQSQLAETQASLAGYAEKMKALEGILSEHDQMKREVGELREQVDLARQGGPRGAEAEEREMRGRVSPVAAMLELQEQQAMHGQPTDEMDGDDDDGMSTTSADTLTWKPSAQKHLGHLNGLGPHHPQPTFVDQKQFDSVLEHNHQLSDKLESLAASLDETAKLGQSLADEHKQSSEIICVLEREIKELKQEHAAQQEKIDAVGTAQQTVSAKVESQWTAWKEALESGWKRQQESWEKERQELLSLIKELEARACDRTASEEEDSPKGLSGKLVGTATVSPTGSPAKMKRHKKKKSPPLSESGSSSTMFQSGSSTDTGPMTLTTDALEVSRSEDSQYSGPSGTRTRQVPEAINRLMEDQQHSDSSEATLTKGKNSRRSVSLSDEGERRAKALAGGGEGARGRAGTVGSSRDHLTGDGGTEEGKAGGRSLVDKPYLQYFSAASGVALISLAAYALINQIKD